MNFADLKKKSNASFDDIKTKLSEESTSYEEDTRFWKPTLDKSEVGYAVIRFLPAPPNETLPWAKVYSHAFKSPNGSWFIENCPTTHKQECPVCQANSELWATELESNKAIARDRKRKLTYYSNIYVVNDPANPENNGKVFLYRYGKKIFDKISEAMNPTYDDPAINPFDFWTGADFKLKITKKAGYWNYDSSVFAAPKPLLDDDAKLEEIWKSQHSLTEFTDPSKFKSYGELETRFKKVINSKSQARDFEDTEDTPEQSFEPKFNNKASVDEEDEVLDYFSRLANS